jgi:hypothetical protein
MAGFLTNDEHPKHSASLPRPALRACPERSEGVPEFYLLTSGSELVLLPET